MSTYVIGDLQGCYRPFLQLLKALNFDRKKDKLWLVGDLVNRGDGSLECLRFVRDLGPAAITVLGNHDLSLLALAEKADALAQANTTLKPILRAPDSKQLLFWLRQQPLMHHDDSLKWTMVHAGLPKQWTIAQALEHAREVEDALRGHNYRNFLAQMYGNDPSLWHDDLTGIARLRLITNCFTRLRMCHEDGSLDMAHKGQLQDAPEHLLPWFSVPERASANERIVFGHWSALERTAWPEYNVWGIDSGCVWNGKMTALQLDTNKPKMISVDCS